MKPSIIISQQLSQQANTQSFFVDRDNVPATVFCKGLVGAEQAALQILAGLDETVEADWFSVSQGGNAVLLTPTNNVAVIVQPGVYRLQISATAGVVTAGNY